ncbi:extracellular solute-binding protein [Rhodococcus sp. BP-252]|uniref:ABC transporter substrate-binding protein n=1 Tax=unclassified Rhodococcus (in: high G+C Gram-positive bacteria) TaxID=192944 RepID=UPI001C9ABA15|nr:MULTISPECIES: extracellular solute-binding protein [unclassified Rhodococcus (in: high G+C Gram-positive bacteria)]MBY6414524.1 extracellular solute-binding protein [Rhodococcus sp. BP-320]MBY6419567.1 extracellular solute-binding protein [Rhodococcus sp. BP-321]MBY6424191.1 extracellular solute-binding protein [Rhodococcus sp. BP-324]MBY6429526.1 extracellular solute-binding protein [Rhodococcus sp. BP-323]MBY6434409.1 extracellular solute-binding protein [Rhodococcus sp. BP-322]
MNLDRRHFLKLSATGALGAGAAAFLAACGAGGSSGTTVTAAYWPLSQAVVPKRVIEDYLASHPDVTIDAIEATNGDTFPKLVSSVQLNPSKPLVNLGMFNGQSLAQGIAQNLWHTPDLAKVPNLAKVTEAYRRTDGLAGDVVMDAMGLAYNTEALSTPPGSWYDLLDPKYRGKIVVGDAPAFSTNGVAVLNKLEGGDEDDLSKGLALFAEAARSGQFLAYSTSNTQLRSLLQSGDAVIASGSQGLFVPWIDEGDPIEFVAPGEGLQAFPESFQIVAGSTDAQLDVVYELMNRLYEPSNVSAYSEATAVIPLVEGAVVPEKYRSRASFGLAAVENSITLDYGKLAEGAQNATQIWNRDVKGQS